jgi:hypothetical protein
VPAIALVPRKLGRIGPDSWLAVVLYAFGICGLLLIA